MPENSTDRPLLVFDGECPFCRAWVDYWKRLTGDCIDYAPYQEVGARFPNISWEQFARAAKLICPNGEVRSGAHAVFTALATVPGKGSALWAYQNLPGFAAASEATYGIFARHRSFFYRVTQFVWGIPIELETYQISTWCFLRALGAIYLIAFSSFAVQAAGLIGSHGILPLADYLHAAYTAFGRAAYWDLPTLFWVSRSDRVLKADWILGMILSALLLLGLNSRTLRLGLFFLYLSLVTAGQVFMSYQWDALLLEAGFLAIFLGSSPLIVRLFRWLLCRFIFLSGAVKLASGDATWRHFTALPAHYETQPLPTPLAWYIFQFPGWFHRVSVGFLFFVEIVVPFLVLAPRRLRHFAAGAIITLQILIFVTGNYAFFNLLTIALCLFLYEDATLGRNQPGRILARLAQHTAAAGGNAAPGWQAAFYNVFAAFVLFISGFATAAELTAIHWRPADAVIRTIAPFEIINTYGLFANMTTTRPEIVIEGSNDGETWLAYEFKYKTGDLSRRPIFVEPHQPRLDWQMWFAALGDYHNDPWTIHFVARLLEGTPEVLALLGKNPFPSRPPHYVRALVYEYRFTTPSERRATGHWWRRELKAMYVPPLALRGQ
jgi:predicted DCC family thiol-disulfide oxidoreductase YuxK